jgi:hypothetical protein
MKKNKYELIDQDSYYRAFQQWLDSSADVYNPKDQDQMDEKWLKFSDDLGIHLGRKGTDHFLAEIIDNTCWKEAKKYYSLITFEYHEADLESNEASVR